MASSFICQVIVIGVAMWLVHAYYIEALEGRLRTVNAWEALSYT